MNLQMLLITALVGWCGNTPRPKPPIPFPGPDPDPDPVYFTAKIIGVVGGVVGGWAISTLAGGDGFLTAVVGAWVGSVIFNDIYGLVARGLKR
jgi:hypothetical protein